MTNADAWSHYKDYTRDITDLSRRLGFGAAAVCWFFRGYDGTFPRPVLWALLGLFVFFALDLGQALAGAIGHRRWLHRREAELFKATGGIDGDYSKPKALDAWPYRLFIAKVIVLGATFALLGGHILGLLA